MERAKGIEPSYAAWKQHDPTPGAVECLDFDEDKLDLSAGDAGDVLRLGHNTRPKQNAIRYLWVMAAAARKKTGH
jgi:hypothetical protein